MGGQSNKVLKESSALASEMRKSCVDVNRIGQMIGEAVQRRQIRMVRGCKKCLPDVA